MCSTSMLELKEGINQLQMEYVFWIYQPFNTIEWWFNVKLT